MKSLFEQDKEKPIIQRKNLTGLSFIVKQRKQLKKQQPKFVRDIMKIFIEELYSENYNCVKDGLILNQELKQKVVGLLQIRNYIVQKWHSKIRIHKICL